MNGASEKELKNKGIPYRVNVAAGSLCTFRIGGIVPLLIEPQCLQELVDALLICRRYGKEASVIGRGSNLLFADGIVQTVPIRTVGLDHFSLAEGKLSAQCGCGLPALARAAAREGFADLAFAAGIPGTFGGALAMNAGAHGREIGALVESAEVFFWQDGSIKTVFADELDFSYRNSLFQKEKCFLLRGVLQLNLMDKTPDIIEQTNIYLQKRRETQPLHLPNAGSTFRRPAESVAVGKMLQELGLKGMRCGDAAVSEKHAGFIVNLGNATAADVLRLIGKIQKVVEREREITLTPEIKVIR